MKTVPPLIQEAYKVLENERQNKQKAIKLVINLKRGYRIKGLYSPQKTKQMFDEIIELLGADNV